MKHSISIYTAQIKLLSLCVLISLTACADKSAIRDKERARYDALEEELINAQEVEERRRRSELRVAQKLRQLDTENSAAALKRMQARRQAETVNDSDSTVGNSDANQFATAATGPVVTQIVVGQPSTDRAHIWMLQDYANPVDGSMLCAVVSAPVTVKNGTLETRVSVVISSDTVFLRTDATFDTSVPEIGYRIDAGIPIAFDHFLNELTAVVDDGYERLLSAISSGDTLRVAFAYLPQLSSAETHVIELSLDSMEQAMSELAQCDADASR